MKNQFHAFTLVLALISGFSTARAQAHNHQHEPVDTTDKYFDELRLVDFGDGNPRWMTRRELTERSNFVHQEGRCAGFMDITGQESVDGSTLPEVSSFLLDLANRPLTQGLAVHQSIDILSSANIQNSIRALSNYRNRYYNSQFGVDSMNWIKSQYEQMARGRADVTTELVTHNFLQPSVIVTIRGKTLPDEVVVLGGHADSINSSVIFGRANMVAPGADDNASGTATLMEVFRTLMANNFQPDRTLMFMAYAGEEVGLLGSQDIANSFRRANKTVVAVLQFDMTSYAGSGHQISFMTDFVSPDLTRFAQNLVREYVKVPFTEDRCGYACSDHASWNKAGYPAIMPFEAKFADDNKAIHTTRDTMALLDFVQGMHFAKLGAAFAIELSAK